MLDKALQQGLIDLNKRCLDHQQRDDRRTGQQFDIDFRRAPRVRFQARVTERNTQRIKPTFFLHDYEAAADFKRVNFHMLLIQPETDGICRLGQTRRNVQQIPALIRTREAQVFIERHQRKKRMAGGVTDAGKRQRLKSDDGVVDVDCGAVGNFWITSAQWPVEASKPDVQSFHQFLAWEQREVNFSARLFSEENGVFLAFFHQAFVAWSWVGFGKFGGRRADAPHDACAL